jgi:death on curing protein
LPASKPKGAFALTPKYIEKIHDEMVLLRFPGTGPIGNYRDKNRLESAVMSPFQSAGGNDIYPTLVDKAAALFHAINADHPFENGCKRTSVIAVDLFLLANWRFLVVGDEELGLLAEEAADYKRKGTTPNQMFEHIKSIIAPGIISVWGLVRAGYIRLAVKATQAGFVVRMSARN